jgi:hypothetical protein
MTEIPAQREPLAAEEYVSWYNTSLCDTLALLLPFPCLFLWSRRESAEDHDDLRV